MSRNKICTFMVMRMHIFNGVINMFGDFQKINKIHYLQLTFLLMQNIQCLLHYVFSTSLLLLV